MWKIRINKEGEKINNWVYSVQVGTDSLTYEYKVILDKAYYKEITDEKISPLLLIEHSFFFLLDQEPPSSILRDFNIKEIRSYFPEYEKAMQDMVK